MKWSDPMCLLKRCDVKHITSYSKKKKKKTEPELGQGCKTEIQLKKKKHVEKQIKHHLKETDSSGHSTGQLIGIFNKSITRIKRNTMDLNRIPI